LGNGTAVAAAAVAVAPVAAQPERVVRPQFTGSAGEYFRIWIVNLFFSLITLGIYSAWAKVRKKRYFYGSTRFDGDSFDYSASPKGILKGRIVAVVVFVVYAFAGDLYPDSRYAFWAIVAVALPWLIVRAFSFNARNSVYRGLRFNFSATPKEAAKLYLGMLAVLVLTAGLALPWFLARYKAFVVSHHAFGTTRFGCELPARSFFAIYIRAGLILIALLIPGVALAGLGVAFMEKLPESVAWLSYVAPMVAIYAAYAVVYAYSVSRTTNLQWNNTFGPGVRFSSTLGARKLAGLYLGNIVAVACTAGLLIPWAVVRTLRYRFDNLAMHVADETVHEASPELAPVGAIGQELGDIFNLDLGL
jgi:uncharacterized membrane protein YjgN (DUF898 family)